MSTKPTLSVPRSNSKKLKVVALLAVGFFSLAYVEKLVKKHRHEATELKTLSTAVLEHHQLDCFVAPVLSEKSGNPTGDVSAVCPGTDPRFSGDGIETFSREVATTIAAGLNDAPDISRVCVVASRSHEFAVFFYFRDEQTRCFTLSESRSVARR